MAPAEVGTLMEGWGFEMRLFPITCSVQHVKSHAHWKAPAVRNPNLQEMALPTYTAPYSPAAGVGQCLHHWLYVETRWRFLTTHLWVF